MDHRSVISTCGRFLSCIAVLLCLFARSSASAGEMNVYLKAADYTWSEYQNGSRLLKESGIIAGPGFSYWKEFSNQVTLKPVAELFAGTVNYDGATQSGIPVSTKVTYIGVMVQCDAGRAIHVGEASFVEPFGGIGIRAWTRDIHDGTTSAGTIAVGYTEEWVTAYARAGLRATVPFSDETRCFAEGAVKLPFYNRNSVYFNNTNDPDFTLSPGLQASWSVEAGMTIHHFTASLFYDTLRFSQSDLVQTSTGYVYQPESVADLFGVKVGAAF